MGSPARRWGVLAMLGLSAAGLHGQILVTAPNPVAVTYPAPVVETCQPPSGSVFPFGTTQIECRSTLTVTVERARLDWPRDLTYRGSFTLPHTTVNGTSFTYNGTGLAYDPQRESLFLTGRAQDAGYPPNGKLGERIAEVSIPPLDQRAVFKQPFTEPSEGAIAQAQLSGMPIKIGGLAVVGDTLYGTYHLPYDGSSVQRVSHWSRPTDLAVKGAVKGLFALAPALSSSVKLNPTRFVNTNAATIPEAWQTPLGGHLLFAGCCTNISSGSSNGPAAFVVDAATFGQLADARPLVYYPVDHAINGWDVQSPVWNGTTQLAGLFIARRSLVFIERHGTGPFCYGVGSRLPLAPLPIGVTRCDDPANSSDLKGTHAYPYEYRAIAYDLDAHPAQPWEARPYGVWSFELPYAVQNHYLNGVAFDALSGRLFIEQALGDGDYPRIHVWTVGGGAP